MPFLLSTRLLSVEPEQIALTVQGHARVRVRGRAYGYVRCGRIRRWVFGAFDETFQVARTSGALWVSALGLGGYARRSLRFVGALDLAPTPLPQIVRRLRWASYSVPRMAPLSAQIIRRGLNEHERE